MGERHREKWCSSEGVCSAVVARKECPVEMGGRKQGVPQVGARSRNEEEKERKEKKEEGKERKKEKRKTRWLGGVCRRSAVEEEGCCGAACG